LENDILLLIGGQPEKCMSYDAIREVFHNPETDAGIALALKNLVKRGALRQFRATDRGRVQNHYKRVA
jgi:hypothetical protein